MSNKQYPYLALRFQVELNSLMVGGFSEVSGLEVELQTEDYNEGGVNDFVHKLPKGAIYRNIILKRGMMDSDVLWKWLQGAVNGKIKDANKSGAIILWDSEGNPKWRWEFKDAYPVKWSGPQLRATGNEVAVETLELVHNGITEMRKV